MLIHQQTLPVSTFDSRKYGTTMILHCSDAIKFTSSVGTGTARNAVKCNYRTNIFREDETCAEKDVLLHVIVDVIAKKKIGSVLTTHFLTDRDKSKTRSVTVKHVEEEGVDDCAIPDDKILMLIQTLGRGTRNGTSKEFWEYLQNVN